MSKSNQAKKFLYLKGKLNQVSVIALLDLQLLCQVSEDGSLHLIYRYLENYSIFAS